MKTDIFLCFNRFERLIPVRTHKKVRSYADLECQ